MGAHPATQFASACLIWKPESIPASAILGGGLQAETLPFDPHDPSSIPMVVFFQTYARVIVDDVREAFKNGETISSDWFESLIVNAANRALDAREAKFRENLQQLFWYLPIGPDPVSTDSAAVLTAMRDAAAAIYGEVDPLPSHVHDLAAKGMSQNRIAQLLGIDRKTVSNHLKSASFHRL
jgi:hypothetical protein